MHALHFGGAYLALAILRIVLLVLSLTVIGLYAIYLHRASFAHVYADSKWVYAVVVGSLSALTTLVYLVPAVVRFAAVMVWDFVLFILWIALFGVFGRLYIHADSQGDSDIQRMKNAVWVDLAGAVGWFVSFCAALVYWLLHRERRSRFTGRARV